MISASFMKELRIVLIAFIKLSPKEDENKKTKTKQFTIGSSRVEVFFKIMFLKILQNSLENNFIGVFVLL